MLSTISCLRFNNLTFLTMLII